VSPDRTYGARAGRGLSPQHDRWIACRPNFFLPVRVLSRRFRTLFLAELERAFRKRRLRLSGPLAPLADAAAFERFLKPLRSKQWVVYSKRPFAGPERVLAYLARYTHRIAISNHRLLSIDNGKVRFQWRDYRQQGRQKVLELSAHEFIRRFLMHIVPPRFHRIRYYGLLAPRFRQQRLELCRDLLGMPQPEPQDEAPADYQQRYQDLVDEDVLSCPECGEGLMLPRRCYHAGQVPPEWHDTS